MTLDNLQYALYLNNCILLDKIKAIKDAVNGVTSTDIEELKKLVDDINNNKLVNINQLITDLDTNLSNHTSNTVIHVTQDDKDLWNATLQNAKDYAKRLFDSVTSFTIEIVDALPTEDIKSMTIYFMRNGRDNESDYYEEYMYVNDKWEIIGSTFVNLAPYVLKEDFEKYQQEITDKFAKYNTSDEITNTLKDYLLAQTFNDTIKNYVTTQTFDDTIKNYTTTEALQKLLEEYTKTKDVHTHENKDIIISPSANNVLTKYVNGYYVPGFLISPQINNAIQKLSDGYYVPAIPVNNATTDDIDAAMDEIDDKLVEQNQIFNERYDIITTKILQIAGNTTKSQVHKYLGNNPISIDKVIDISTLYNLSSDVILNLEIMIKNTSDVDTLTLKIEENGVETLKDMLTKSEVQRYKLPNIPTIEIFIKGDYQLFLYVTYI